MSDTGALGNSERRDFRPERPIQMGPLYRRPFQPRAVLKWLFGVPGYLFASTALQVYAITAVFWLYLTPEAAAMQTFSAGWIAAVLMRNFAFVLLLSGLLHLWLYSRKAQGTEYKYNGNWPAKSDSTFLFNSQLWDNVIWSLCSAPLIWTAYEAVTLWMHANGFVSTVNWETNPIYCTALFLLLPLWMHAHFYFTHRLLHWQPLFRHAHHIHHKNVNFGPWSGLAMHPVEHLVYFSGVMLLWFIPSHPAHAIFMLVFYAYAPLSHVGFHRVLVGKKPTALNVDNYMHYLHHKYVSVNFGNDVSVLPLDKWLGTFHDGSPEATDAMKKRARERILRTRRKEGGLV